MTCLNGCLLAAGLLMLPHVVSAQQLVLQSFGSLENDGGIFPVKNILGSGRLANPGDHGVQTDYVDTAAHVFVEAKVFEHGDPTWVLHEFEDQYRTAAGERFEDGLSILGQGATRRFQLMFSTTLNPGGVVAWLSGAATVVNVKFNYGGTGRTVVVPQDIVDAYLALYPSSLPEPIADTPPHHTQWVRDEMRRILEYAARDHGLARTGSSGQERGFRQSELESWLQRFADFRERFYAVGSGAQFRFDVGMAKSQMIKPTDPTGDEQPRYLSWQEQRLSEFQSWWSAHETDPVLLPTPGVPPRATATIQLPPLPPKLQELVNTVNALQRTPTPPPAPTP